MKEINLIDSVSKKPVKVGDTVKFCTGLYEGKLVTLEEISKIDNRVLIAVKPLGMRRVYAPYVVGLEELS